MMRRLRSRVFTIPVLFFVVLQSRGVVYGDKAVRNGLIHDGVSVQCDLPESIQIRNVGSNVFPYLGLCVWASTDMMAQYLYEPSLIGIFNDRKKVPGGGSPPQVDEECRRRDPTLQYDQYQGPEIDFVRRVLDTGRPCCVTYGYGELYGNRTIAHMVLCVHMDDTYTAILDNNDPGSLWWMSTAEFKKRFGWPGGQGWAWAIRTPPPPPVPHN